MATNSDILSALNEIIDKLDALDCPCVEVHVPGQVGGTQPEQSPGGEEISPPTGTSPADETITDRKCKAANLIVDDLISYTYALSQTIDFDNVSLIDFSGLANLLASLSETLANFLMLASGSLGTTLTNLAQFIISGAMPAIEMDNLVTELNANVTDMKCVLYNASDVTQARNDLLATLTLTQGQQSYLEYILSNNALNMLFYAIPGSEIRLDSYVGALNCASCQDYIWIFDSDSEGWTFAVRQTTGGVPTGSYSAVETALRSNITKTSANNSAWEWRSPIFAPGVIVSEGTLLRARVKRSSQMCSGGHLRILFTDTTEASKFRLFPTGSYDWISYSLESSHNGKEIDNIYIEMHDGDGCGSGSNSYFIDQVELQL